MSVVLAGQAFQPATSDGVPGTAASSRPSTVTAGHSPVGGSLPAAPRLDEPPVGLVTVDNLEVSGRLVEDLPRDAGYRLRLYVNGELVRDRRLPRRRAFTFPEVPLREGPNAITAAIAGPAGESLHSPAIEVELDTQPPALQLAEPAPGVVYAEDVIVRGTSEAGATVSASNRANRAAATLAIEDDGQFEARLPLVIGSNDIVVEARDRAGNAQRATVTVERMDGRAGVSLSLTRRSIALTALPATMTIRARVLDPTGQPVDDAEVTLTISPPGLPTQTHVEISREGNVTWAGVRIARDGAQRGQGLVTVLVVMPDGTTLQGSEFFTIQ
ncbi:MAG TPA: Ig-like domain-containing protein [Candidatus Limnocylindrales bacterium]|nr:Ig-like domain-containing protein [Candidatus Limnocylindrales bacterium]